MKKLLLILLLPIYANSQTLTIAQLTTRLVAAEANITAINTKLSGIYTTLDSYKAQLVGLSARTAILEAIPKDTIKVVEGLTLSNKTIGLDTAYTNKMYAIKLTESAIVQLANMYTTLGSRTKTVEGKLEDVIGRVIILEAFRAALKNL
jgi:uncharacterized membrane-anchored protein YhcB (DUF1043 family)